MEQAVARQCDLPDNGLILRCEVALAQIYADHFERLVRYVTGITDDEQMAQDVVQEVFSNILSRSQSDPEDMSPKIHLGYFYASIRFKIKDCFKHLKKVPHISFTGPLENSVPPKDLQPDSKTIEKIKILRENEVELRAALEGLKPNERRALQLHFFDELDTAQIAQEMDLAVRTIQHHIKVGKSKLAAILGETFLA